MSTPQQASKRRKQKARRTKQLAKWRASQGEKKTGDAKASASK